MDNRRVRTDADLEAPSPAPTLREAMGIGGFREAKLVAGAAGLDRPVEWVRVMETPQTAARLRPNELLLTTGFAIRGDPNAMLGLLASISERSGAGLVVQLGQYLEGLPESMAFEADRLAVPLFTMPTGMPWSDLMNPLLERIINAEHQRLKRSIEIHSRFTDLVLDGKGVNEICRTLSELLDSSVTVEDASFHLLAHAGGAMHDPHRRETIAHHGTPQRVIFDPQVSAMLRRVAEGRHPMKVPAFPHVGMVRERLIAPITNSNQVLGYISVLDHPANEELAFMAVEQAAIVVALALTKEREVAEVEGRVRGEYLDDLVQGTYGDEAAAQRRARHLGYPLTGTHVLLMADIDDFRGFLRSSQISEDQIQALKRDFLRRISAPVRQTRPKSLLHARSDAVMTLIPSGPEPSEQGHVRSLAAAMAAAVHEWGPGFSVSVAYSSPVAAPQGLQSAHREVLGVLATLARFGRRGQVVGVSEIGLTGLLAGVTNERLNEFATLHLRPLAEHDRLRKGKLLETLRTYLEAGEQLAAAQRLGVHPNTLRYRLDRIREISGANLEEPETRLNLSVALRVQALLDL